MKILFVEDGHSGIFYHRQLIPHCVMQARYPDIVLHRTKSGDFQESVLDYDLIVLHGQVSDQNLNFLSRHKKPFVYDVDDYFYCGDHHSFYTQWKLTGRAENMFRAMKQAALVTTTTDILGRYITKHTGVTAQVLPNAIGVEDPQFKPVESKSDRLRFAFIGGSSHVRDVEVLGSAIRKLWEQYPEYRDTWQIVYGGFSMEMQAVDTSGRSVNVKEKDYPSVKIEKILSIDYELCSHEHETELRKYSITPTYADENYRRLWSMSIYQYAKLYNEVDVCLAPLEDDTFNRCKSNLKVDEAGWMGKEVICSDIATFKDGLTDRALMMCTDSDSWLQAMLVHIEYFIQHGTPHKSDLPDLVRQHYTAENYAEKRYNLYKSLL